MTKNTLPDRPLDSYTADFASIGASSACKLFGAGEHAVPVELQRPPSYRMLWLNRRAMHEDPQFDSLGRSEEKYRQHLLDACAFITRSGSDEDDACEIGYADRYGGIGIGNNGGSGRAVVVNGYLVKGVGKTPLIGVTANPMHASGGAYLEECVRESIFAEIICAEFPSSAIPTLAIIDTGITQHWSGDVFGPPAERRVLLVRPCMLRPAHFERATLFHSSNPKEGVLDFSRVRHVSRESARLFGKDLIIAQLSDFLTRWAGQLAYAYVHRLSPSGNSTSNICFDGKLLDFGACSALPSWARINMIPGSPPTGGEFGTLVEAAKSLSYHFARCFDPSLQSSQKIEAVIAKAKSAYDENLVRETLRVCGLPGESVAAAIASTISSRLALAVATAHSYFSKEAFDIYSCTPEPSRAWDVASIWDEIPPSHLAPLRAVLDELAISRTVCGKRNAFISRSRPMLYREEMKAHLHRELTGLDISSQDFPIALDKLICRVIANSRRDSKNEISEATNVGFAVSPEFSMEIYQRAADGAYFGVIEWASGKYINLFSSQFQSWRHPDCLQLSHWTADAVFVAGEPGLKIDCAVAAS